MSRIRLITCSLWRLSKLHIFFLGHESSEFLQCHLDGVTSLPARQDAHLPPVHQARLTVHSLHADAIHKPNIGRLIWILWATLNLEGKHAVFKVGARGPDDHACPVGEGHVGVVFQSPADGAIAHALLPGLEFFQEAEIAGHN